MKPPTRKKYQPAPRGTHHQRDATDGRSVESRSNKLQSKGEHESRQQHRTKRDEPQRKRRTRHQTSPSANDERYDTHAPWRERLDDDDKRESEPLRPPAPCGLIPRLSAGAGHVPSLCVHDVSPVRVRGEGPHPSWLAWCEPRAGTLALIGVCGHGWVGTTPLVPIDRERGRE